jgi:hypothetical protein
VACSAEVGHYRDQSQGEVLQCHVGRPASARQGKDAWDRMSGIIHTLLHGEA